MASRTNRVDKIVGGAGMRSNFQIREDDADRQKSGGFPSLTASDRAPELAVSLLTGGADRPYVFGLGTSLISRVAALELIGSDDLDFPEFHGKPGMNFS